MFYQSTYRHGKLWLTQTHTHTHSNKNKLRFFISERFLLCFFWLRGKRPSHVCRCHYPLQSNKLYLFIIMWKNTAWLKEHARSVIISGDRSHVLAWCRRYESFVSVFTLRSEPASWKTNIASTCFCSLITPCHRQLRPLSGAISNFLRLLVFTGHVERQVSAVRAKQRE